MSAWFARINGLAIGVGEVAEQRDQLFAERRQHLPVRLVRRLERRFLAELDCVRAPLNAASLVVRDEKSRGRFLAFWTDKAGVLAARLAKSLTGNIPTVFVSGLDPGTFGLVESLNRPGGNWPGDRGRFGRVRAARGAA